VADNKDVRKILKNIEKFIKNGKFQNAINEYLKLLQINPKDLSAINQLGDLYVRVGNYREAYKYYKKLAEYYERTDVIPKSIAIYRKIYRLDPKNIEVAFKLGELFQKIGAEVDAKKIYIDVAEYLKFQKKTDEVLKVYKKLAELDRENVEILTTLAEMYRAEHLFKGAAETYSRIGDIFKKKGNVEKAVENYKTAFNLDPNLFTLKVLIDVYRKENKTAEAISFVEDVVKKKNDRGEFKKALAQLYLENKNYEKAEKILLELSKEASESDVEAYEYLAKLYVEQDNYDKAFEIIEPIVDLLLENNKENKAQDLLNVILTKNPQFLPALQKRAEIFEKFGKENSLMLVLVSIAEVYEGNGEYDKAKEIYERLLVMDPNKEEFRFELERLDRIINKGEDFLSDDEKRVQELEEKTIVENLSQFVKIFDSGFKEEAIREVQNLSELYPSNPRIKEQLLDFLIKNGSLEQALKTGHQLIEIYERLGDKDSIAMTVERLIKYFPNDPLLNNYITSSKTEISMGEIGEDESVFREDEKKVEEFISEIDFFINNSFFDDAEKAVNKALELYPGNNELIEKRRLIEKMKNTSAKGETQFPSDENDEIEFEEDTEELYVDDLAVKPDSEVEVKENKKEEENSEEGIEIEDEIEMEVELPLENSEEESIPEEQTIMDERKNNIREEKEEEIEEIEDLPLDQEVSLGNEELKAEENVNEKNSKSDEINIFEDEELSDKPNFDELDFDFDLAEKKLNDELDTSDDITDLKDDDILNLEEGMGDFENLFEGEDIFDVPESYYYEVGTIVSDEVKAIRDISEEAKDNVTTTMEKNLDDILSQFKEKLEDTIEKEDYATRYNLGIAYFGMGLYDEAINDFLISSKSEKYKFDSFVHLGLSFFKKGVFSEAEKWFKEALKVKGRSQEEYLSLKYELASLYEIEGKINESIQLLREIIKEDKSFRDAKDKLDSLLS